MQRWWSRKYNLPPNHELCTSRSVSDLMVEMYGDLDEKREELRRELAERTSGNNESLIEQINRINAVFEEPEEGFDPLIEKWERELEEGLVPDLEE